MLILKLLVVDDEPGMRRGAFRALRKYKFELRDFNDTVEFEISQATTGNEALDLLSKTQFDIILLDYKLDDISGLEILDRLKKMKYDAHTVMMTAFASLEVAISATKSGAFDFLAKPFTPEELRKVVKKASTNIVLHRKAKKLEEDKKKVRFQFLSVLSHELKAPLNAIDGYLRVIDDRVAGNDIKSYDNMIKRSMERINGMRKLIFDLLDLTRIESGQKIRKIKQINLIEAVERSIETNKLKADERNISINLDAQEKILMNGELSELEIMFNNLISNAVKYNKENGYVNIKIEQEEDSIYITVEDGGIGMKPEEQKRLFGEFVRFKNEKTANIEGSGLGLSILKKLISLYKGTIKVKSEFGTGTTFFVTLKSLPAASPPAESA
ncbi:MAG: hybrid sensor histidine kinase/response regulator [Victivallales bacterium]|nr:hybrid sensor histidine kinase/response regulator [Victivallales bacterium]MCF7888842.1 hybrid sensor histidine kinase/response regulator [Victivallales bacterium]